MTVFAYLAERKIPHEIVLHRPVSGGARLAACLHVPGRMVAKSVLVVADGVPVVAVLPATHRIDLSRLAGVLGAGAVRLATAPEVAALFHDCERGATPPFGGLYGVSTVLDTAIGGSSAVYCEGNARHLGLRLRYRDLEAVVGGRRGRFSTTAPRARTRQRRAG
jgi:Ala-tRNA(Pro) deacylase